MRVVTENEGESALVTIALFDRAEAVDAVALLRPCCASRRWLSEVISGRPYESMRRLASASDDIVADLSWSDLAEALAAHARIGDRPTGRDRESTWSRQEQSGAAGDDLVAEQLMRGNLEYEARFGHVFLICASGRTAAQMCTALRQRLTNPTVIEREVVRDELRKIVRLRLIKTFR
jgi:2-oxo-4-hydroxy-4-carboxy-5-ureidoimidazoline decarboxylase